ncbi:hypothetical protein Droror1_Dr00001596 [Drosera rotundifolia]
MKVEVEICGHKAEEAMEMVVAVNGDSMEEVVSDSMAVVVSDSTVAAVTSQVEEVASDSTVATATSPMEEVTSGSTVVVGIYNREGAATSLVEEASDDMEEEVTSLEAVVSDNMVAEEVATCNNMA